MKTSQQEGCLRLFAIICATQQHWYTTDKKIYAQLPLFVGLKNDLQSCAKQHNSKPPTIVQTLYTIHLYYQLLYTSLENEPKRVYEYKKKVLAMP